jgi:hypothetical protein
MNDMFRKYAPILLSIFDNYKVNLDFIDESGFKDTRAPLVELIVNFADSEEDLEEFYGFQIELAKTNIRKLGYTSENLDFLRKEARELYDKTNRAWDVKPTRVLRNILEESFSSRIRNTLFSNLTQKVLSVRDKIKEEKQFVLHRDFQDNVISDRRKLVKAIVKKREKESGLKFNSALSNGKELIFSTELPEGCTCAISLDLRGVNQKAKQHHLAAGDPWGENTFNACFTFKLYGSNKEINEASDSIVFNLLSVVLMGFSGIPSMHEQCRNSFDLEYLTYLNLFVFEIIMNNLRGHP